MARGKGRPALARAGDVQSIIDKIEWEKSKADAKWANSLEDYYKMLEEIAMGTGRFKGASTTNRKSAIETIIKRSEDYLKEDKASGETASVEEDNDVPSAPLIQLTCAK